MRILTVIGARPQFIKASVVSRQLSRNGIEELILHTGQHFDKNMSEIFFGQLNLPRPSIQLDVNNRSHGEMTGEMLLAIEPVVKDLKPSLVLVYGDTNSTLAGALAAVKLHVPVAHVEAGLRSFNMKMPEEVNRVLTDHMSSLLFCPTTTAIENLRAEGFEGKGVTVELVGDVMYDASIFFGAQSYRPEGLELNAQFVLATLHRAENTDDATRLIQIIKGLNCVHESIAPVVMPIHPRTKQMLVGLGVKPSFSIIEPVGFLEMLWLQRESSLILTDSGGVQKEAYFSETPCLTLRDETEWTELIAIGANELVGADQHAILRAAEKKFGTAINASSKLYGHGDSSAMIASSINAFANDA